MKNKLQFLRRITPMLALAVIMLAPSWGWAQPYAGIGTFTKITSLVDLTDGYYVIVNSGEGFAMNSTNAGSFFTHTAVTPASDVITNPAANIVWKIETNAGGLSIYNEASAKYVSYTGTSNAAQATATATTNNQRWTFTDVSSVFTVTNMGVTTRFLKYNPSSPRFACYTTGQQDLLLYKMGSAPTTPTILVSPTSMSGFTYEVGDGPSTEQEFTVSGLNLTADISIAATANYEISKTSGSGYDTPLTYTQTAGAVAEQTVYVRLIAGLAAGDYNSEIITATSAGATNKTVTCSGSVTAPPVPGYLVDFEGAGETKGSYTSGTVTLSGLDWDMTEALIGTEVSEWKNGIRSARMRGYGTSAMTMLSDKSNGIGTVSFNYRRYGTDTQVNWKVEYSTNAGVSWTQIGSDFTAPLTDVVQLFSEVVNVSGNIRIRIKRATETGTSNSRLNIDDIMLSDFGSDTAPIISNIVQIPDDNILSTTTVSVSADVTDSNGTIEGVELSWGIASGSLANHIVMSLISGSTYTTDTDIPAQSNGVTVYYEIYAIDDAAEDATSAEQSYTVTDPVTEPTNHPSGFEAEANSSSAIIVAWVDAVPSAAGYLIKGSATSYEAIFAPVDGTPESDDLLVQNFSAGDEIHEFTGLSASTQYFFKIYPYNGAGTAVNYKTDGTVPSAQATTDEAPELLVGWDFNGLTEYGLSPLAPTTSNPNITVVGLTRGSGVKTSGTAAANGWGGAEWETTASYSTAISNSKFVTFTLEANAGYGFSLTTISPYNVRRSSSGPTTGLWQYKIGNGEFASIGTAITWGNNTSGPGNDQVAINLTSISALQNIPSGTVVTFRIVNYGASGTGTWYLNDPTGSAGDDFIINGTVSILPDFSTFTGIGNWSDDSKWYPGPPNAATDAVINGNVTVDGEYELKDLTISPSGAVTTLETGNILYILGDLLIQSDASGTGSFIGTEDNYVLDDNSTTTVQRYLTKYNNPGDQMFHYISSPVTEQAFKDEFIDFGSSLVTDLYYFDEVNSLWKNARKTDGTWDTDFGNNFVVGKGYMVAYPAIEPELGVTKTFTGALNSEDKEITCTNTASTGSGWNLLGNPFSSAIDWDGVTFGTGMDNALYYYENANHRYVAYIQIDGHGIGGGSQYIPAMQGFMVHAKTTGTKTVTLSNAARTHSGQNVFYKSTNAIPGSLSLKVATNGYEDEAFIHFNQGATTAFDGNYDAYKLKSYSDKVPMIYTKGSDGNELAINGLPELDASTVIPVFIDVATEGAYTLTANLDGLPNAVVNLVDIKLNKTQNLKENPSYSFTASKVDEAGRFKLTFTSVGIDKPGTVEGAQVYAFDNVLYVETSANETALVNVYNLTGQLVMQGKTGGDKLSTFNASSLSNGVYVVNVILNQGVVSHKVVIRK